MKKSDKKDEEYLPEDKKMLEDLENSELFNPRVNNDGFNKQLQIMQIKATLRNIKAMKDMDKSTSYFSKFLAFLALIQIIIAIMQYTLSVTSLDNKWLGLFFIILLVVIMVPIIKALRKDF